MDKVELQKNVAKLVKEINFLRNHPNVDQLALEKLAEDLSQALANFKGSLDR